MQTRFILATVLGFCLFTTPLWVIAALSMLSEGF